MLASLNIGGATYGAFIVIALVVLALAGYLITIAFVLKSVTSTLSSVLGGVQAIANQTAPVGEVVGDIAANVLATQNALRGVLGLPSVGRRSRTGPTGATTSSAAAPKTTSPGGGTGPVSMPGRNPLRAPGPRGSGSRGGGVGAVSMRNR